MRIIICSLAATLALASLAGNAHAQSGGQLYKWKDANGVTHYSQTPPASGQYQTRNVSNPVARPEAEQAPASAAESPACTRARANLQLLQSDQPIRLEGGDDTPLSAEQRKAQMDLAEASIRANCTLTR